MTYIGLTRYDTRLTPDEADTGAICPECLAEYSTEVARIQEGICLCGEWLVRMDDYEEE
jgi:hypothetical protein